MFAFLEREREEEGEPGGPGSGPSGRRPSRGPWMREDTRNRLENQKKTVYLRDLRDAI